MEDLYPPGPSAVPPDLSKPTRAYRRHAWLACLGLSGFVALYGLSCFWCARTAYRCFAGIGAGSDKAVARLLAGVVATILAVFLVRALFGVARALKPDAIEITAQDEPALFDFISRLADDTGAPRPHRVFLSPGVNAAVFYDLSILNLLLPSRKNLEIGLGLANALHLSEFKAVLAHEMGHFAQRSMAVGRWVYVSQQIAGNLVARRDWFDRALGALSSTDIRIAWLGWLSRLIVWSLRALLDTAFQLVIVAQRALAREMEFQADLVAVSVSGSDALVHALHRAGTADEAWDRALRVALQELSQGRRIPDLFALQTRVSEHLRQVAADEHPPSLPPGAGPAHRIFQEQLALAPRMWATHPSNREREDNCKRVYVPSPLDERPAWLLFRDPAAVRRRATRALLDSLARDAQPGDVTLEAALGAVDQRFQGAIFDRRYRGVYIGRSAVLRAARAADLYAPPPTAAVGPSDLDGLYPPSLARQLAEYRSLETELASLQALRDGILDAPGGVIRHRGRTLKRKHLERVVAEVQRERDRARALVDEHERRCRTLHHAAAAQLGGGWPDYLHHLAGLWHYAAHAEADVDDARGYLENVLSVVTAGGRVAPKQQARLVAAAREMQEALLEVHQHRDEVGLPACVGDKLGVERWTDALPSRFTLAVPLAHELGPWLQAIHRWHSAFSAPLGALERCALECLLEAEARVDRALRDGRSAGDAPPPPRSPLSYRKRLEGNERPRQRRLHWWDRFLTADGLIPGLGRLAVAGAIVASVLGFGGAAQDATLVIHNGLHATLDVHAGEVRATLSPGATTTLELSPVSRLAIETRSERALVEAFEADVSTQAGAFVYNVAGASPLFEWTAVYGNGRREPERALGAPRWLTSRADVLFGMPPKDVQTRSGGATRRVLQALDDAAPRAQLIGIDSVAERARLIAAHARWDGQRSAHVLDWLELATELATGLPTELAIDAASIVRDRLARHPRDVAALRTELDGATLDERAAVCARHRDLAASAPDDVDLRYVAARCMPGSRERDDWFVAEHTVAPQNAWLANAAGLVLSDRHQWRAAADALSSATSLPALRESASLRLSRVLRLVPDAGRLPPGVEDAGPLRWLVALERGTPEGPERAYAALARGALSEAVELARPNAELGPRILRLAAGSDGAASEIVERALLLDADAGLDAQTVWVSAALARREQRPLDGLERWLEQAAGEHLPVLRALLEEPRAYDDLTALEQALTGLPLELQGDAYVMGAVLHGHSAPRAVRDNARALLYPSERPYFD